MKKTITLLLVMIATLNCYSQFSKVHYIPPLTSANSTKPSSGAASSTDPSIVQYIYISTPSTTPVTVTLTPIGSAPVVNATVTNTNPWVYQITTPNTAINGATFDTKPPFGVKKPAQDGFDNQLFVDYSKTGMVLKDKGFLIQASDLVYANVRVTSSTGDDPAAPSNPSQAGGLVAKGLSAYGTDFRIGGFENKAQLDSGNYGSQVTFASFIATEDNTKVTVDLPKAQVGITTFHNGTKYTGPFTVNLNKNESYTFAIPNTGTTSFDSNFMIGGHITSDRNIVVNSGSIGGNSQTTPNVTNGISLNKAGKDYGFDQIVGADKIGKEYVFIGGAGMIQTAKAYDLERVIIVANKANTQIFKNGNPTAVATLQAGDYYAFNGNDFVGSATAGYNLYVTTSENVFAYQCIAGKNDAGNQNMFFVPPLNCATPSVVNNIPLIQQVGLINYTNAVINITTEATISDPTPVITVTDPVTKVVQTITLVGGNSLRNPVTGKPGFFTYTYPKPGGTAPLGHIAISAPKQIYVSYYGSNDNATYGSYFSGFDLKPNISTVDKFTSNSICNTTLKVTGGISTDKFEWQFSTVKEGPYTAIPGATGNTFTPTATNMGVGYYSVTKISACTSTFSDPIAVSACPEDTDKDGVLNNIDVDSDNDGITNKNESYGDKGIDVSGTSGTVTAGSGSDIYNNSYTTATTTTGAGNTFTGNTNGSFTTNLTAGNTNSVSYELKFPSKAISAALQYTPAGATSIDMSNAAFEIKTALTTTITISNPTGQLLIDTDNDGIYESGVTEFSSFDIKFKLNPTILGVPTPPAIDFKIQTYMANSITFTHTNTSTSQANSISGFSFTALSIPKNSDGTADGDDQVDTDSDNDGILDIEEGQSGNKTIATPLVDANKNGLADNFEPVVAPVDTDGDLVPDFIDLDSDNDGILDSIEGTADSSNPANAIKNYRETDSDGDTCKDVVEAGFTDPDNDGKLGTSPITVDAKGKVTGGTYPTSVNNYYTINKAPTITTQPSATSDCATKAATVTCVATNVGTYKWQVSTNGGGVSGTWTDVVDIASTPTSPGYSGATTGTLSITNAVNGYFYRVDLSSAESACVPLRSNETEVKMTGVPVANDVTMEQCDTDLDGKTTFDLTAKNAQISSGTGETFSYYETQALAIAGNPTTAIQNATTYTNATPHAMDVYARVQNSAGCYDLAKIALTVGVKLPNTYVATNPSPVCDDAISGTNTDGFTAFDLTATKTAFEALFPSTGYTVTFYPSPADASSQTSPIPNSSLSNYRNTIANTQTIGVRINNNNTTNFSGCYSLSQFVLNVEALPIANTVTMANQCDDNHDGKFAFNTANLETALLGGQTNKIVTYLDAANNPLKDANGNLITSPFPATFTTASQTITAVVTNNTAQKCSAQTNIQFVVETLPTANPVTIPNQCDDNHDGKLAFNTATLESTLLGGQTGVTATYFDAANNPLKDANGVLITSPFPASFTTTSQTIKAVVTNNAGLKCSESTNITFTIESIPTANPVTIPNQCDDNHDGKLAFNTAALESTLLGGQTGVTATYFDAANNPLKDANGVLITSPFPASFTTTSQTIKAVVTNNTGLKCSESTNITFTIETIPTANPVTIPTQCDDNLDGKLTFNTTNLQSTLLNGQTGVTVTYFDAANNPLKDANGVLITSPFPASFTTTSQTIKAVVTNNAGLKCSESTNITFTIEALPTANAVTIPIQCDDNHDGKLAFNTANLESTLLGGQTGVTATYLDAANNPLRDANGVLITSPFPASFVTTSQTITAVVTNNTAQKCSVSTKITFTIEAKPVANTVIIPRQCDDNQDGILTFSTTNLQSTLLNGQTGKTVTYFDSANNPLKDANGVLITSPFPANFTTTSQIIKAVVTNNTPQACSDETFIEFIVDDLPQVAANVADFISCDDEADPMKQDGRVNFNTSSVSSTILGNQTGMRIEYTAQNGEKFVNSLPNPYLSGTQIVNFEILNASNPTCSAHGQIQFTVNPLPKIDLNTDKKDDKVVCSNLPGLTFDLDAAIQDGSSPALYTYQWYKDGVVLSGETSYTLDDVNIEGVYAVDVSTANSCSRTRTITVRGSEIAKFNEAAPFTVTDLTEDNTITVNLAPGLKGDYEYSMDDEIGYYQSSNVFTNVSPGTHSIYVRDKNGCGIQPDATVVIGVPKFFTPNNDGYNDYWTIYGVEDMKYTIFIYDRYGKLLKELIPQGKGWDGIFNGNLLPGSDYWYSLKLENGREAKGHFSLKR